MPNLRALVERYSEHPFALIGINTGDSKDTFRKEAEKHGVDWPCAWQGPTASPIAKLYRVSAYPTILVLDAQGRIRARNIRGSEIEKLVSKLLEEMKTEPKKREPKGTSDK